MESEKLDVVGYPEVELLDVGKDGFSFKATVPVYPEVTLGQYKGLEAPKAEVKVTAADVNHRLKEMAERNSRLVSVDRPVKKGDIANIDFEGFDDGKPFDGGKGEGFDLEIGSGSFVPGFEDQLIGMKRRRGEGHRHHLPRGLPQGSGRQGRGVPCEGQRREGQGGPRHRRRVCQGRQRV